MPEEPLEDYQSVLGTQQEFCHADLFDVDSATELKGKLNVQQSPDNVCRRTCIIL